MEREILMFGQINSVSQAGKKSGESKTRQSSSETDAGRFKANACGTLGKKGNRNVRRTRKRQKEKEKTNLCGIVVRGDEISRGVLGLSMGG